MTRPSAPLREAEPLLVTTSATTSAEAARPARNGPARLLRRRVARVVVVLGLCAVSAVPLRAQDACTTCHANHELLLRLTPDSGTADRLLVDSESFAASVHGTSGMSCVFCHQGMEEFPHDTVPTVECGACHARAQEQVASSIHGRPHPITGTAPASCKDCHGSHDVRYSTDPESTVFRLTQFEVCATCHSDEARMAAFGQEDTETVRSYLTSIHGHGLVDKGLSVAPVCTDCHGHVGTGAHEIAAVTDPESPMVRDAVAETCGRCHLGIVTQWKGGIHGTMFEEGNRDVPTCTDCHAEHGVQPITSEASHVYPSHIEQTCTACHDRLDFNQKYGLPTSRGRTFLGSFHGIALSSGELTVANCESCHGAHGILPSTNPASKVHPANLRTTCGTCHPAIGEGVVTGKIHVASIRQDVNLLAYGVQWFYYVLIAGIVVFSAVMIGLDQYRHRVADPRRGNSHG